MALLLFLDELFQRTLFSECMFDANNTVGICILIVLSLPEKQLRNAESHKTCQLENYC